MRLQRGEAPELFDLLAKLDGTARNTRLKVLAEFGLAARGGRFTGGPPPATDLMPPPTSAEAPPSATQAKPTGSAVPADNAGHELDGLNLDDLGD